MMTEPTFDADGYPTDETESAVQSWPILSSADAIACMDFVGRAWKWPDWGWEKETGWLDPDNPHARPTTRYLISTGGWSGNETLVSALEDNQMVQMLGWWSSRRGGHYEYRFAEEDAFAPTRSPLAAAVGS